MNDNTFDIEFTRDEIDQLEREAKEGNFSSTEAYVLHLVERGRRLRMAALKGAN